MQIKDMMTFEVNGKKCVALVRKLTERECFGFSQGQSRRGSWILA